MILRYEDIYVKHKLLLKKNTIALPDAGVYLLLGDNGSGKTLLLNRIHAQDIYDTVLVAQESEVIPSLSVKENISMVIDSDENDTVDEF